MAIGTGMSAEERIRGLGLVLPDAPAAVANYKPWVVSGNLIMTSGNLPWAGGKLAYTGAIGAELTLEQGYQSCQLSCLNAIAQLKVAAGDLERVKRVIRLEGTLFVTPGFADHPKALNGASDLIEAVFKDRNHHTRMIYANSAMPLGCTSLIVLYAEL